MKRIEKYFELMLFRSRWLLAPFYVGLIVAVLLLLVRFVIEVVHIVPSVFELTEAQLIVSVLTLIDISLVANLLLIITFSGYESFVSKIDIGEHEDRPAWMGKVGFSTLKIKVIGSIVAISAIELLKAFIKIQEYENYDQLMWQIGVHLTFVVSGVLFALMDKLANTSQHG